MTKTELRHLIRQAKRQFSQDELGELSLSVIAQLESDEHFINARTILAYHSLPDEVFTHDLIRRHSATKTILLPKVIGDGDMEIRRYTGEEDIKQGAFGIMEPCGELFTDCSLIDLAIIPGMAFDRQGNRLGRGKGYYDRFLSRAHNIYKVGICFPFQMVERIPTEPTDIAMDEVLCSHSPFRSPYA